MTSSADLRRRVLEEKDKENTQTTDRAKALAFREEVMPVIEGEDLKLQLDWKELIGAGAFETLPDKDDDNLAKELEEWRKTATARLQDVLNAHIDNYIHHP